VNGCSCPPTSSTCSSGCGPWAALDDPDFRCLYLAFDQARDWDPDDPRLGQLAARALDWVAHHREVRTETSEPDANLSLAASLMAAQLADTSPALRRLAARG
jgi:hypothetical protein